MQEEIFGPVLPVLEFDDLSAALEQLRHHPTPLALYLFTRDRVTRDRVLAETRSGLPFGGLGESGFGAYHGQASFDCFTHYRSVLGRSLAYDLKLRYPPPRTALRRLRKVFRFLVGG